ncbi:MAG: glycosyltransferase family 2 protein [Kineosporiaceae bacterium]
MRRPTLAAALIVKDEEDNLPGCLASLDGAVDEIVVYDTGSTDATVQIAERAGARVQRGYWDGDFARARNAALEMTSAAWVLSIDADERVVGDPGALRALLARADRVDLLAVRIRNVGPGGGGETHEHPAPRLLHRNRVRWTARLHEHPVRRDRGTVSKDLCPREVLRLDHLGYADADTVAAKIRRNQEIAQAQLDSVVASGEVDPDLLPRVLLNLGRSHLAAGELQRAVDALETLREMFSSGPQYLEGTAALAELLATNGPQEAAFVLADELQEVGSDPRFCDWVRAQALVGLNRPQEALVLLLGIDELIDPIGRVRSLEGVTMLQVTAAERAGETDTAAAALIVAMVRFGRVEGQGVRLLRLWGARPSSWLADLLLAVDHREHLDAVLTELRSCPGPGPDVAEIS